MKWVSTLKYLPINYAQTLFWLGDMTQRVCFENNLSGGRVRLHFSNRFSSRPLCLERVTVGIAESGAVSQVTEITFRGERRLRLEPDQELFSDAAAFEVRAGQRLAVNVYVKERQGVESIRCLWSDTLLQVAFGRGDRCDGSAFDAQEPEQVSPLLKDEAMPLRMQYFFGFDAIQVETADDVKVLAAFGDSITHMSCVTNALARRLYAAYPGRVTLLNCGVGGNRLVHDATYIKSLAQVLPVFGEAGVKRFEKDVFGLDSVDAVLMLIGINDIMHPIQLEEREEPTDPELIAAGYRRVAQLAHAHGAKLFAATVMPCGNDSYPAWWLPKFEAARQTLNACIRSGNDFDGVFDYDAAVRDEERPGYLLPALHCGDGLHPNDAGGAVIAAAVDLPRLLGFSKEECPNEA